jgi:hypothetical protein
VLQVNKSYGGGLFFNTNTGTKTFGGITVNSGGAWNVQSGNEDFSIAGDIDNDGLFNSGGGIYSFSGGGTTDSRKQCDNFYKLNIDNNNGLSLTGVDATINGTLLFSNGKINTGANTLILGNTAVVSGA